MKTSFKARLCLLASTALMTAPSVVAMAQGTAPPPPTLVGGTVGYFGEHGQIAVSSDLQFNILHTSRSAVGGAPSSGETSYLIQPAVDYFVSTNVSVGGAFVLSNVPAGGGDVTTVGIAVRAGYNVVVTNSVSLWVRAGLTYDHLSFGNMGAANGSGYAIPFSIYAPILWHPVSHLFIGLGPVFQTDLVSKVEGDSAPKITQFGLQSTIGGYFGGL